MDDLLPCPCGMVPTRLVVSGENCSPKFAHAEGDCCGYWAVEFRNQGHPIGSTESNARAREAWNAAPRAKQEAGG